MDEVERRIVRRIAVKVEQRKRGSGHAPKHRRAGGLTRIAPSKAPERRCHAEERNRPAITRVLLPPTANEEGDTMGRYLLLWLLGIPIPILLLIWVFGGLH